MRSFSIQLPLDWKGIIDTIINVFVQIKINKETKYFRCVYFYFSEEPMYKVPKETNHPMENSDELKQARIYQILEKSALENIDRMKPYIDEAKIIVSKLEKAQFISPIHDTTSTCSCKSCMIYTIAHQLKQ